MTDQEKVIAALCECTNTVATESNYEGMKRYGRRCPVCGKECPYSMLIVDFSEESTQNLLKNE